jgi:uncharacterized protein HemY
MRPRCAHRRPKHAVLLHQLGQIHRSHGAFSESRACFEQCIALRETEPTPGAGADARLHLARTLEDAKLFDEARAFAVAAG